MTTSAICRILRKLSISGKAVGSLRYSTSCDLPRFSPRPQDVILPRIQVKFTQLTSNSYLSPLRSPFDVGLPVSHQRIPLIIIDSPINISNSILEVPKLYLPVLDQEPENSLELPTNLNIEKQAARLIVIRRRKMRRHKLRKLRKKMKFVWRRRKQRRELRKEKAFQAELLAQIRKAETFDAREYVDSRLKILDNVRIPSKWRGEVLPEAMIRQFMKEKEERRLRKINRPRIQLD